MLGLMQFIRPRDRTLMFALFNRGLSMSDGFRDPTADSRNKNASRPYLVIEPEISQRLGYGQRSLLMMPNTCLRFGLHSDSRHRHALPHRPRQRAPAHSYRALPQ